VTSAIPSCSFAANTDRCQSGSQRRHRALAFSPYSQILRDDILPPSARISTVESYAFHGPAIYGRPKVPQRVSPHRREDSPVPLECANGCPPPCQHHFRQRPSCQPRGAPWPLPLGASWNEYLLSFGSDARSVVSPPGATAQFSESLHVAPSSRGQLEATAPSYVRLADYRLVRLWFLSMPLFWVLARGTRSPALGAWRSILVTLLLSSCF